MDSYEIKILNGSRAGESIPLASGSFILGRAPDINALFPEDLRISSRHCEITIDTRGCFIHDLASRNGTYLNHQRISKPEALHPGDTILIGSTSLEFAISNPTPKEILSPIVTEDPQPSVSSTPPDSPASNPPHKAVESIQCRLRQVSDDGYAKLCWISLDQSMEIGRSEWNDYSFPNDTKMSGKHFRVTLQRDGCVIEDLQSKHGTWMNGVRIERCALVHGSTIQAGSTIFHVEMVGIEWASTPNATPMATLPVSNSPQSRIKERTEATRSVFSSGLLRIQGKWDEEPEPIAWVERLLAQKGNVYLLLDLGRVGIELAESQNRNLASLFDWLPTIAQPKTPCLFDVRTWPGWPSAIEDAWGSDAMMVLTSQKPRDELLGQLRTKVRGHQLEAPAPDAIQGICWPSVLRSLLEVEATGFANEYFGLIDAVWMEGADDPQLWDWIGKSATLDPLCKSMGIRLRDAKESKAGG